MTIRRTLLAGGLVLLVSAMTFGQSAVEKTDEGIMVQVGDSFLKLEVCSAEVVRVAFAKDRGFFARKSHRAGTRSLSCNIRPRSLPTRLPFTFTLELTAPSRSMKTKDSTTTMRKERSHASLFSGMTRRAY